MRLINIETLQLEEFFVAEPPPFAILSHAWGPEEVTLQDLDRPGFETKQGWTKIIDFCRSLKKYPHLLGASNTPLKYAWVDTCCIDKTNIAELSEAINSMFKWYYEAVVCFAFFTDFECTEAAPEEGFEKSRWFTRGWTLQELIAPKSLEFFDKSWRHFGSKASLANQVSQCTNISLDVLVDREWSETSVAQRMAWAAGRQTTKAEDIAYCLLGIFDINMPLLYGEGGERAFLRLQEEILKQFEDQTIFVWDASDMDESWGTVGMLAPHPRHFARCLDVEALPSTSMSVTSQGIHTSGPIIVDRSEQGEALVRDSFPPGQTIFIPACNIDGDLNTAFGIPVVRGLINRTQLSRLRHEPIRIPKFFWGMWNAEPALMVKRNQKERFHPKAKRGWLEFRYKRPKPELPELDFVASYPPEIWRRKANTNTLSLKIGEEQPDEIQNAVLFKMKMPSGEEEHHFVVRLALDADKWRIRVATCTDVPEPLPSDQKDLELMLKGFTERTDVAWENRWREWRYRRVYWKASVNARGLHGLCVFEINVIPVRPLRDHEKDD